MITEKSAVRGAIYDGDFAYNDLNDDSFIGTQIAFVSGKEVEYGRGQYATALPDRVDDRTATVSLNDPGEPGFLRDRDHVLVMTGDGSLDRSVIHYRLITDDGGRRGSEGGQFEPAIIGDLVDRLGSEGDVYTFQTMTFMYTEQ